MRAIHKHHATERRRRALVWPAVALWLVSSLAQAADCCCGPEALSSAQGQAGALAEVHEAAHSLADHHDTHHLDVGATHDDGTTPDGDRGCSEVKQPDANVQSNWIYFVAPNAPDQPGPLGFQSVLSSPSVLALRLRSPGILPPSLNPFLSTIRLLL